MLSKEYLDEFITYLRFASISTDSAYQQDIQRCSDWLVQKWTSLGLQVRKHETPGHPIVIARNEHRADRKTVLIYGHYDVQPVDPVDLWDHPPFEPQVKNGVITGRGTTDNKGQTCAHLFGIQETLKEKGELPVNLIFLVEGEEEIGSPHLVPFLEEHREELKCDVIVVSDTGMIAPRVPTFTYGLRGVTGLEIRIKGPSHDLHSGIYGGAVANPLTVLARLVSTLHDEAGRIQIEGFYDGVRPLESWEKEAWAGLPLTDEKLRELTGAPELAGEAGYTSLERVWVRPTAEVNGLYGGYQGEGTKTVLPSEACLKLTFRTVPGQHCGDILDKAEKHFRKYCPSSVHMEVIKGHHGESYLCDPRSAFGLCAQNALEQLFPGTEPALIREGGSIPIVPEFKRILGVDTLLLGLGLPDCRAHSPNENFHLENLEAGIRLNKLLLEKIAAV